LLYASWLANFGGLSLLERGGLTVGTGIITGVVGIVAGHELCHKATRLERGLGRVLLCAASYGHFYVEHTLGHHKDVATDHDAATSRYGESFYEFLPRVVKGEFLSACRLEAARLRRKGLPWWHNEIPVYFLMSGGIALALAGLTGSAAVPLFVAQSFIAVLLFESVNYLEHYGLERRELMPGQFEPVQPQHSWDTACRVTNHVMFKLERHADHHAHAGKRYQTLQVYDSSPQLPAGYATMILLSFFPPLWRAVMHPRLMEHRRRQAGQIFRHGPTPSSSAPSTQGSVCSRTCSSKSVKVESSPRACARIAG
jgi:alkane 1-monooxygenase